MVYSVFVIFTVIILCKYHISNCRNQKLIDVIFFLMWIIFAIEYYTTKDYPVYYNGFNSLNLNENWEPLYRLLITIFQPFGFIVFNACVTAFEIFTLRYFFKKIVPPYYRWVSLCILILDTNNLFLLMNFKRQFFAMMVALWIIYFLLYSTHKYKYVFAALAFLCAINIHSSAYISIGYFALPLLKCRLNKAAIVILLFVYIASVGFALSTFSDQLMWLLNSTGSNADYYDAYILQQADYEGTDSGIGIFSILSNVSLLVLLLFYNKDFYDKQYKFLLCSVLSILLMNIFKGNFYRLYLYYSIFNIFTVSILLQILRNKKRRLLYIYMLCLSLAVPIKSYYNAFFSDKVTYMTIKYKHFYTIFHSNPDKKDYLF